MDYFNDVLTTFLGLERGCYVAVYGGSESSISSKISNPGSLEIRSSKYISAAPLLRTLLHVSQQFQSETSGEWH